MRLRLRFLSLSKTLSIFLQSSICFSFSPPSSSKKWMERFSTSREPLGWRRPSDSRGSVSARKPSSPSRSGGAPSNSSTVDHKDRCARSNLFIEGRTSPELCMGSSNAGSLQGDPENHPFDICKTESKGPPKLNKSFFHQNPEKRMEHEHHPENHPFDICRTESKGPPKLNKSFFHQNREKRMEHEQTKHRLQGDPENHPFDICRTESKGPAKLSKSLFHQNREKRTEHEQTKHRLQCDPENHPFDICRTESKGPAKLNKSLFHQNREKRTEHEQTKHLLQKEYLIPGMVLLRNFIEHDDQVKIVERCRQLGIGVGGFYRPGYGDGAKLNLQMMCLGKNWDPESRQYGGIRPCDGSTPPKIPEEFRELVDKAIQASHEFLRQNSNKSVNLEDELPRMSPDICIVNFYSKNGRLGLHQDRDESKKSIDEGLPVVSFSLGDNADFLYGNNRDVDSAKTVVLKSGDVLLFGGKSRLLFHGVSTIHEGTAPSFLIDKSKLKPGRLNLTFRQY